MRSPKTRIAVVLSRESLKHVVEQLGLDGVDRRSADAMRQKLQRTRRGGERELVHCLRAQELREVCSGLELPTSGRRDELAERVLASLAGQGNGRTATSGRKMQEDKQIGTEAAAARNGGHGKAGKKNAGNGNAAETVAHKQQKLTLAPLERRLFEACDILRGNMDASEYKEFIFGALFMKRLSDQFDADRAAWRQYYEQRGMRPDLIEKQLANRDKFDFFVPPEAHWSKVRHLKQSVGSGLNKALAAIEDPNLETLQDVLKTINFNQKVGQRTLDDSTLVEFIQHFDRIPLSNDAFEFPDLLGAAYEYLIKYFADSAGKKGGEFYTPAEVVRMMVHLIEPREGMEVYDPCAGSGGMLIQSKEYVREIGADSRNLALAGQELNGGTWAVCKMNMILHGVRSADIRQGDTIRNPLHLDSHGEVRRFDRVIANPPFSQNYSKRDMQFPERFHTFLPESGKKADLMFVQHMVASLKSDGKLAVVMPHGVLFRGGEERECRKRFIKDGILEAVIGLPPALFYGTGIPACVLVINKAGAPDRRSVLLINADREYHEGKNQNSLRPEDIEKITHVYHNRLDVPKYARNVPVEELEQEDFNLNIRRYVDNSPPPEPHDVRAHLHGGVPVAELESLAHYFDNYAGTRELLFHSRAGTDEYLDFAPAMEAKESIKELIEAARGVQEKHAAFQAALAKWWAKHVGEIEALPETQNVFELRQRFLDSLSRTLVPEGILDLHQVRGVMASYMNRLEPDFKSVAASGWGPELIPEQDILQSQFPDVLALAKAEEDQARITELEGLFAAADAVDEDEEPEESEDGVLPKELVKSLKEERKQLNGQLREVRKLVKAMRQDIRRMEEGDYSREELNQKRTEARDSEAEGRELQQRVEEIDARLARHNELETELKQLRANLRQLERKKDELVAEARAQISEEEARRLILERFENELTEQFGGYLRQYQRGFVAAIENLWDKYALTLKQILAERDQAAAQLDSFLKELGYE